MNARQMSWGWCDTALAMYKTSNAETKYFETEPAALIITFL